MSRRKVERIDQRLVDRLADELAPLLERGSLVVDTAGVDDVDRWRRAARQAARRNGWRVRTGISANGARVWAVREDREVTMEEQRAAMEAVTARILRARQGVTVETPDDPPVFTPRGARLMLELLRDTSDPGVDES